jgi:RNA polymerase sigma-70 factor (ECF subfamily)
VGYSSVDHTGGEHPTSTGLVRGLKVQDQQAWERLVRLYGPMVYRWGRQAGLQPADAADVGQEVFRAVARKVVDFHRDREGDTFHGWLRAITRNKIRDYMRGAVGKPIRAVKNAHDLADVGSPQLGFEPTREEEALEKRLLYQRAMYLIRGAFEDRSWQAFMRVVVDGRAPADAASELHMTLNAVYLAKSRILRRLREEFVGLLDG